MQVFVPPEVGGGTRVRVSAWKREASSTCTSLVVVETGFTGDDATEDGTDMIEAGHPASQLAVTQPYT